MVQKTAKRQISSAEKEMAKALSDLILDLRRDGSIKNDADFAAKLDFSKTVISEYKNGHVAISFPFIDAVMDTFGVDLRTYNKPIKETKTNSQFAGDISSEMVTLLATTSLLRSKVIDLLAAASPDDSRAIIEKRFDKEADKLRELFLDQFRKKS